VEGASLPRFAGTGNVSQSTTVLAGPQIFVVGDSPLHHHRAFPITAQPFKRALGGARVPDRRPLYYLVMPAPRSSTRLAVSGPVPAPMTAT